MDSLRGEPSGTAAGAMEQQLQQSLVGEDRTQNKMRVMVAIDESDESFCALKWVLDYLYGSGVNREEEEGMVTLVHVQQPFHHSVFLGPGGAAFYPPSIVVESVTKGQEQISAAILSRAFEMCKAKMIRAETLILEGDPKDRICQATEQMHVDLLVIGSRGLGKIKRAFLGSVSDYCAHHAKCPVLIVKPPKETSK